MTLPKVLGDSPKCECVTQINNSQNLKVSLSPMSISSPVIPWPMRKRNKKLIEKAEETSSIYCNCVSPVLVVRSTCAGFSQETTKNCYSFCTICKKERKI